MSALKPGASNRDKLAAALTDLLTATTRSGQGRYATLLLELIKRQPTESVAPLRIIVGRP